jgi:GTP-binding protein
LQVGQPQVIIKEVDGVKHEPVEVLTIDVPEEFSGKVIELVSQRKGDLRVMEPKGDMQHLEFEIPARGIIGLRNHLLTASAGEAIVAHRFKDYEPWKGDIPQRTNGVIIAKDPGKSIAYAIDKLQDRGYFFVDPGEDVYTGMIIGEQNKAGDMVVNITQEKKLTNMRASGSDDKMRIAPAIKFSLEESMEYIQKDEYVEITPNALRIRKIHLDENTRKRASAQLS